uniref:Uncharacterized protein n=1 Tax=Pristionchus pacificus TaxID=54126 RepID=A0A2A6BJQ0_PRIPA|eukprot:PDM66063.1 hypothetical protein PRIPAC_45288 [Pristionchus pacificus]
MRSHQTLPNNQDAFLPLGTTAKAITNKCMRKGIGVEQMKCTSVRSGVPVRATLLYKDCTVKTYSGKCHRNWACAPKMGIART